MGFVLRIYLSRSLGAEMMGVYQVAISVFMVLLTLTASGIPFVVSRKTAGLIAHKRTREEHRTLTGGLVLSLSISLAICLVVFVFQKPISLLFANAQSLSILLMLLPAIVFNTICAAFRGNLWGHKRWSIVSCAELIEQISRIIICFLLINQRGEDRAEMAALSLSIACLISCLFSAIAYFKCGGRLAFDKNVMPPLFKESLSITSIRVSSSLINSSVAVIMPFVLVMAGLTRSEAMSEYGAAMGMAFPILYLPSTIIGALAFALVPELAKNQSQQNTLELHSSVITSIVFSVAIGALFVPLFFGVGSNMGMLIYDNQSAGRFMQYSAWVLIPIALEQITSSIMNSINLEIKGFTNYLIGTILLFLSMIFLTKYIGVHSLSLGFGASLTFSSILDILTVKKKLKINTKPIVNALALSALSCVPCSLLTLFLNNILSHQMHYLAAMILSGACGLFLMLILLSIFKVLNLELILSSLIKKRPKTKEKSPVKSFSWLL